MLMINDKMTFTDTFWFTLYHEIGHIINGDFGISFEKESGEKEENANYFAQNILIDQDKYKHFINKGKFDKSSIIAFSESINRDSRIVIGRLRSDRLIDHKSLHDLCNKCKII